MRKRVYSGGPLEKKVGYCRATRVADLVFVSGSTAMKDGQVVGVGDPAAQTRQTVATIENVLREDRWKGMAVYEAGPVKLPRHLGLPPGRPTDDPVGNAGAGG